jgi:hypothetical protein
MEPILAVVWHQWIGVVLALSAIVLAVMTGVMYFVKVVRTRYPH